MAKKNKLISRSSSISAESNGLYSEIRELISTVRQSVVTQANQVLAMVYWHIGERIQTQVLQADRAQYGKQTI